MRANTDKRKKLFFTAAIAFLAFSVWSVSTSATQEPTPNGKVKYELKGPLPIQIPWGLDVVALRIPEDNPIMPEKVELGKLLFFDRRLSADGTISCADCHNPRFAFADGRPVAQGIRGQKGGRGAPTIINRAFSSVQFWDGRTSSLEEQAIEPMINPIEMGNRSQEEVVARLRRIPGYRMLFLEAFGVEDFTIDHVAKAIATFERTALSGNSPFDRFQRGERAALSAAAERGFELFRGKARCITCHSGSNFTDEQFHTLGLDYQRAHSDFGRYQVTQRASDRGKFKTPTLREIANTAPYMHDGRFQTLEAVVDYYDRGGIRDTCDGVTQKSQIGGVYLPPPVLPPSRVKNPESEIEPLRLSKGEKRDLVEFLKSLSGEGWQHIEPPVKFPQ